MRVLITEDKARMAAVLQRAVQREGFLTLVAHDGETALDMIQKHSLNALILDVMLPKLDGFAVLQQMRSQGVHVPTILLTARDSNRDIVHGLDLGADDYLTKPFDLSVLLARLRALTRRPTELMHGPLKVGDLLLRRDTHDLQYAQRTIALTPMEYTLLEALMLRAGHIVRKEALAEIGWGEDGASQHNTLYVFMRALRKKLHTADGPDLLHTVRGVGYVLRPPADLS